MENTVNPDILKQFDYLKQNLSKQDIPLQDLHIAFRDSADHYIYGIDEQEPLSLNKEQFTVKAPLFAKIFEQKSDRDVILTCRPKYVVSAIGKNYSILPVLDDLPQIVGLEAKLCQGDDEKSILKALRKQDACLLKNHNIYKDAVLAIGSSLSLISATAAIVEKSSQAMVEAEYLGGAKKLSYRISANYRKAYLSSYSKMDKTLKSLSAEDYPRKISVNEMNLRRNLVDYGNKLVEENLTQGTWGNLSVRLDQQYMLITPSGMAYSRLTPYDMVRVDYHTMKHEGKLAPSVEQGFHAAIYRDHKDINGMIHTHSFNCSVFAAANQALPIIMPSAIARLGSHSGYCPYEKPGSEKLVEAVATAITDSVWACIMGSHGMAVCGSDLKDTFERTLLLEQAARYYLDIHSQGLGPA